MNFYRKNHCVKFYYYLRFILVVLFVNVCGEFNTINASVQLLKNCTTVPLEIRLCEFDDHVNGGTIFLNGKKTASVKSGQRLLIQFPIDSALNLKIKVGKISYFQDGFFNIDKTGGILEVDCLFRDSLSEYSIPHIKNRYNNGWMIVNYYSGFKTMNQPSSKDIRIGKSKVGVDVDLNGCLGSAGYEWSDAMQNCIRVWEVGVPIIISEKYKDSVNVMVDNLGYVVFSDNTEWAEIFTTSKWDLKHKKDKWMLQKFGESWRYNGSLLIEIKLSEDKSYLDVLINNIRAYKIINNEN